jgi:hypothetical protein
VLALAAVLGLYVALNWSALGAPIADAIAALF